MIKKVFYCLAAMLMLFLQSCSIFITPSTNPADVDTTSITELENLRTVPRPGSEGPEYGFGSIKLKALQETGMSLGAQAGLAWSSDHMNERMRKDSSYLDTIFNFNAMMLTHGVIPPVLEQGDFSLNLADPTTIRVADRTYRIVVQARFATTPPNWREYLWFNYSKPQLPDKSLFPRNKLEAEVWRKAIRVGWERGISQAHAIFQQNLARLKRDYNGMVIYRKLLQAKMISPPFVARTELGVTGSGEDMRINDQVLRIVELPTLQTNSRHWKAIVIKNSEAEQRQPVLQGEG